MIFWRSAIAAGLSALSFSAALQKDAAAIPNATRKNMSQPKAPIFAISRLRMGHYV